MTLVRPLFSSLVTSSGYKVHRIPVEAFPNFWAYTYVIQVGDWNVLIDTGSGSEISNSGLDEGISKVGIKYSDLTHILLTHGHIDHYGGLAYLRERSDAKIGVHELDQGTITAQEVRLSILSQKLDAFLITAGVPAERRDELLNMYHFAKGLHRCVAVDFTYETQGMKVGPFELLHTPGHCAGHVSLKFDNVVFCGDLILERVIPHQSPETLLPFMGIHHFQESLTTFEHWVDGATLALNGHDEPIKDLSRLTNKVRNRLNRRIDQTLGALSEPRTVEEVTEQVYGKTDGYNSLLVIEKVGAYIEYLYQRGLVDVTNPSELNDNPQTAIKYQHVERPKVVL